MTPFAGLLAVVPARGQSKRVPLKNIRPLAGRPLLEYTLEALRKADVTRHAVVSTDAEDIAAVAQKNGVSVLHRPPELSRDEASTESVLLHVLETLDPQGKLFQWVLTLPPTSPFRKPDTIRLFAQEVQSHPLLQDCLMSVTENRGDFWRLNEEGIAERLFPDAPRRQQERTPLFEENSAVYITSVAALKETGSILGRKVRAMPIDALEAFDVNTLWDFKLAEAIIAGKGSVVLP